MTRIDNIRIDRLSGRSTPIDIELNPDLNVFFGLNGTGKTSLLKVIYSAVRNRSDLLAGISFESAAVTIFSQLENTSLTRRIRSGDLEKQEDAFYVDEDGDHVRLARGPATSWKTSGHKENRPFEATFLTTSRLSVSDRRASRTYPRGGDSSVDATIDERFAEEVQLLWRRYTNKTLSEVRQIQQSGLAQILQSLFSDAIATHPQELDAQTAYYRSMEFLRRQGVQPRETLKSFTSHYASDVRLASIVHEIDSIERRIESAEEPRRKLQELIGQFVGGKEIEFTDREIDVRSGDTPIPLTTLSSGEKQLIRILVDVINAGVSTIIIDEPELSMHIDWQHELLASLRTVNPEAQIIVATHSPEIMANVPDAQIYRL
ncbi:ATP-binding protein [Frondihabitans sp. 4ASC-45]|uniref:AAA family ATPase n=1 Tax=Frondihabitans sp. 4ASC-45 TaxID=3111636 RepID=UPI003C22DCC1